MIFFATLVVEGKRNLYVAMCSTLIYHFSFNMILLEEKKEAGTRAAELSTRAEVESEKKKVLGPFADRGGEIPVSFTL